METVCLSKKSVIYRGDIEWRGDAEPTVNTPLLAGVMAFSELQRGVGPPRLSLLLSPGPECDRFLSQQEIDGRLAIRAVFRGVVLRERTGGVRIRATGRVGKG